VRGRRNWGTVAAVLTSAITAIATVTPAGASPGDRLLPPSPARDSALKHSQVRTLEAEEGDPLEIADRAAEFANARIAPGTVVPPEAIPAGLAEANRLPQAAGAWREVTNQPYEANPDGFVDPVESNVGTGWGKVSGRVTALATDGALAIYAGAADGGVWRTFNQGKRWFPAFSGLGSQSIGAVLVDPAHRVWVGTGEPNTNADSYQGQGVYISQDFGTTYRKVGGPELDGAQVYKLLRTDDGSVFAATTHGLWRHSANLNGAWQRVFAPDPNPNNSPYRTSFATDVAIKPGTHGGTVLTAIGWRGGTAPDTLLFNGFYVSTSGGAPGTFSKVDPTGDIDATDIGRTTFTWAGDGKLWAIVESPRQLAAGDESVLQGVFVSANGNPAGPWKKVADDAVLAAAGSALANVPGFKPGVQSWYNQTLLVDPANPKHVYVSLEEVFETTDGGASFHVAGPYWNLGLSCNPNCPNTTHPDQHALAITGGNVWAGNDGGVWHRPLNHQGLGAWVDTNPTLHILQYYGAGTGKLKGNQVAYWGGLQDNGTSVLNGLHANEMIQPAGGDGGLVLVDPNNGARSVGEYVNLALYLTTDGGRKFRTISPVCLANPDDQVLMPGCDPTARFIAPFAADAGDPNHWVAGGQFVWDDHAAWNTRCHHDFCDWRNVHDLGAGRLTTSLAARGDTIYAGWVAGGGNPGPAFASGIDTNAGGTWHTVNAPNLPQRVLFSLTVDPANANHVYAIYSGYSRHWIPGGGVGHVFESRDGGSTWTDISGNLPDIPADDLVIVHGNLVLATDIGVFIAGARTPTSWSRLGFGLPGSVVADLTVTPDGDAIVAATHGRGLWQLNLR
jgi:hypothetical protein